jgi:hypothetical protein
MGMGWDWGENEKNGDSLEILRNFEKFLGKMEKEWRGLKK